MMNATIVRANRIISALVDDTCAAEGANVIDWRVGLAVVVILVLILVVMVGAG
jgi:hypothetical protein